MNARRVRVLVADDEVPILEATSALLDELAFDVRTHSDADTIHDALRDFGAEILLQDVRMPGLDVAKLVGAVRRDPATKDTRIVLFSAGMELHDLGRELGVRVVEKPFRPASLAAALRGP